jgi:LPS export ABC transporter protein LptC
MTPSSSTRVSLTTLRSIRGVLLTLLVVISLGGGLGCREEGSVNQVQDEKGTPDQILWSFSTTSSDSGKLSWIFKAAEAQIFSKTKIVEATGVRVDMYDEGMVVNSTLDSDSGVINRRSGDMTVIGNVSVVSAQGHHLVTEVLHWDQGQEIFENDVYFELDIGPDHYTGVGFISDLNWDNWSVKQEVQGVVKSQQLGENLE